MADWDRQSGRTTKQMQQAPDNAVFVWCNSHLAYPEMLARALGRDDLAIWALSRLSPRNLWARKFPALVIDHAALLGPEARLAIDRAQQLGTPVMLFNTTDDRPQVRSI
jgi:ABC-type sugar transport system substrate-binding protein